MLRLLRALQHLIRRKQWERELNEELETHQEMKRRELEKDGYAPRDLHATLQREMGNVTLMKDEARSSWIIPALEGFAQDMKIEVRRLLHAPGFAFTVIAILALGIGLNAAVFTLLNAVALRPIPLPEPERVVYVLEHHIGGGCCSPPSWLDQRDIREQQHTFESLAAYSYSHSFLLTAQGMTRHIIGGYVTPDYFSTLGVQPVIGRLFTATEAQSGRENVVLLREDFWRSELGGNPGVLQQTLTVNGVKCYVVGILPSPFRFPFEDTVIWAPLVPTKLQATERGWHGFPMVGRIKRGVSLEAAHADVKAIMYRLSHQYEEDKERTGEVFPLQTWDVDYFKSRLVVLQIAALAIFLMTCANVSSLLLARHSSRRKEFAVRAALGASRLRRIRQHLSESLMLALLGCGAGIGTAWAGVKLLLLIYQNHLPRRASIAVDWRLVLFMAGIALCGAVVFGLATAFHENTTELEKSLRESGRSSTGGGLRLRRILVVAQMACSVTLLAGSGELIESFWRLLRVDTGMDTALLTTMRLDLPNAKYKSAEAVAGFFDHVLERIHSLPQVESAGSTNMLPVAQMGMNSDVEVEGMPAHSNTFFAELRYVTGAYFPAMGTRILRGRAFLPEEAIGKQKAMVINETMAQTLWNDKNPVGYRVRGVDNANSWFTVVGVVRDVRQSGVDQPARSELFVPLHSLDEPITSQYVAIRARGTDNTLLTALRREVTAVDSEAAIYDYRSMNDVIYDSIADYRITAALLSVFAVLALLLAGFGIYGVISFAVTERRRELAIRMALGAQPSKLIGMILGQSAIMIGIGAALGVCGVFYVSRLLANLLYGTKGASATLVAAAILVLAGIAVIATLAPALRAVRVDPMLPLREE